MAAKLGIVQSVNWYRKHCAAVSTSSVMGSGSPTVGPSAANLRGLSPVPDPSLSRLTSQDRLNEILEVRRLHLATGFQSVYS